MAQEAADEKAQAKQQLGDGEDKWNAFEGKMFCCSKTVFENDTIKHLKSYGFASCFGTKCVEYNENGKNNIHIWTLKIVQRNGKMTVGVASDYENLETYFHGANKSPYFAYHSRGAAMSINNTNAQYSKPGSLKTGSTVVITLDLNKKEISFNDNDDEKGVAYQLSDHDAKKYKYKLAASLLTNDDSIQIVKYESK